MRFNCILLYCFLCALMVSFIIDSCSSHPPIGHNPDKTATLLLVSEVGSDEDYSKDSKDPVIEPITIRMVGTRLRVRHGTARMENQWDGSLLRRHSKDAMTLGDPVASGTARP